MNLYLNSPSHFTQEFGVIDDIYKMCEFISLNIDIKKYTNSLDTIGIVPMIAPLDILEESEWNKTKYVSTKFRMANISICSSYDDYYNANLSKKKRIILDNILSSLKIIKSKLKTKFNYDQMEKDILNLYEEFNNTNI